MRVRASRRLLVLFAAVLVFLASFTYALVRPPSYESEATLVLVPKPDSPRGLYRYFGQDTLAESEDTYTELLANPETMKRAGYPKVGVTAVNVLDTTVRNGTLTRIIRVTTRSRRQGVVRPALRALVTTANARQPQLRDFFRIETLSSPSSPSRVGAGTKQLFAASALLSLLAALAASTLFELLYPDEERRRIRRAGRTAPAG